MKQIKKTRSIRVYPDDRKFIEYHFGSIQAAFDWLVKNSKESLNVANKKDSGK